MPNRSEVYAAIDAERDYQDRRWKHLHNSGHQPTSEYLIYMRRYLVEAEKYFTADDAASALETIRKITALGVACMEQNGAPTRKS